MGELNRKDNSLAFRSESKNNYLPIEGIKEIFLMNEVNINTKLLNFLSSNGVVVHFFSFYGTYVGTFYPREKYISGRLKVKQVMANVERREVIARSFVNGIRVNSIELLNNRKKSETKILNEALLDLKYQIPKLLSEAKSINQILAVEGQIWNHVYRNLNDFINPEFISNKRVKRPPDNPLNAMISYGNSLIYAKTITQIYHTHLDQSISFLHEPSEGRFSLSLDLAEVFKLNVVLPVIINMINKNMIKVEEHFEKNVNYCYLNEIGRKKFTLEIEKKLDSTFEHRKLNRKVSYLTAIKLDGYKLVKDLMGETLFSPFNSKEMI